MKKRVAYAYMESKDEEKRLNRIIGQIEGIRSMLEEQRKIKDVLAQCKAVRSAVKSVESRLVSAQLRTSLENLTKIEKKKERAEKIAELETLFKNND